MNCSNNNNCGCNHTPCSGINDCACKIFLSSDCINDVKAEFECLSISSNLTLTQTLEAMDSQICEKFETVTNYFTLLNVGSGVGVYKGVNLLGQKELKSLASLSNLLTITSNTNTIDFNFNTSNLNTYIQANQKTYSVESLGSGAIVYKTQVVTGNDTKFQFKSLIHTDQGGEGESVVRDLQVNTNDITLRTKKIKSDTLTISATDTEISIEQPEISDIPNFIVNSAYTGTESTGVASKPFKTIEDAKTAYIGTGDAQDPEFKNANITVQRGTGYTYTGNLNLNMGTGTLILEEGTSVTSNPASGDWLCDFDTLSSTEPSSLNILLKDNALLTLVKSGFRNGGTSVNNSAFVDNRSITISGNGTIFQSTNNNSSVLYTILESNFVTTDTLKNDSFEVFNIKGVSLYSLTQQIYKIGGNSTFILDGVTFQSFSTNSALKLFNQIGGSIRITDCQFDLLNASLNIVFSLTKNTGIPCSLNAVNAVVNGSLTTLFQNENTNQSTVTVKNIKTQFGTITNIAKSPNVLWTNFIAYNCIFDTGVVDQTQVDLTANNTISTTNIFNSKVIESLQIFGSRALAVVGGLQKGNAFINRKTILTADFIEDEEYQISVLGTGVNWTSIGAASATVGLNFTYNGVTVVGTGGEAYAHRRDILI